MTEKAINDQRSTINVAGLYIHIPFCLKKCKYCDFHSYDNILKISGKYIGCMMKELKYYFDNYKVGIETLYVGGGTPLVMAEGDISRLFSGIYSMVDRKNLKEITIEANPETVTREKAALVKENAGRVSLGAQCFDDETLRRIGRVHDSAAIVNAVQILKNAGIRNLNIDIMYGLPGQKLEDVLDSINKAAALAPEHISFYMLTLYEDTPLFKEKQEGKVKIPLDEAVEEMYLEGARALEEKGYFQYEISNFARPGFEAVHNSNYWKMGSYIGIGSSASSYFREMRYSNFKNPEEYIEKLEANSDPAELVEECTGENYRKEYIMLALRTVAGINTHEFRKKFGFDFASKYSNIIKKHEKAALMAAIEGRVFLTRRGLLLSNEIIEEFF